MHYFHLLRPEQWIKNVFIFAGLIFSREFHEPQKILTTLIGFFLFCFLSSAGYILNDIIDREKDRQNPLKNSRPIASGRVKIPVAILLAVVLAFVSLLISFIINYSFFYCGILYLVLSVFYSLLVKNLVILDVLLIGIVYVLRSVAGALIINVDISSWLVLCTFLLALFIILSKRKAEMMLLGEEAGNHRRVLTYYSVGLLNNMITIVVSACIVAYCIYTLSPETVGKFHTKNLIFTVPFVVYGLFRYLYIVDAKAGAEVPGKALISDLPLFINLLLWGLTCILIIV